MLGHAIEAACIVGACNGPDVVGSMVEQALHDDHRWWPKKNW
jgi:hypothetical protein